MGRQENSNHHRKRVNHPYCPFKKFCVFLRCEDPARVLAQKDYLRNRVDELEFGMDFTNYQVRELQGRVKELQARVKELESEKSQLQAELPETL